MTRLHLVHGPPGTGKTTYLSQQCERAVEKHGRTNVAIASLTRTAAQEIASKTDLDDGLATTLHAHAFHALDRPDLAETPEGIKLFNAAHPAHKLTGRGPGRLEDAAGATDPDAGGTQADTIHNQVMTLRASRTPRTAWNGQQLDHDTLWTDWKTQTGRLDFTDLIEQAITETPTHPAAPRVWLFDEAQDFSTLELELAQRWAGTAETAVMVGDLDQAIYGWRGADPKAFERLPFTDERTLEQSHRVPQAAHAAATHWIQQIQNRKPIAYHPTTEPGHVALHPGTLRAPEPWLDDALHQLDEDPAATVMILASCGYMLQPLIHALRRHGIPFHNPWRPTQGAWNPLRGARRLKAFLRPDERVWGDQARWWTWQDLQDWTEPLKAGGTLTRGAKTLIENKIRTERFGDTQADQDVPLDTLLELLGATDTRHPAIRMNVDWWQKHLLASQAKTAEYPLQVLHQQGPAALAEQPRLVIGTVHSVKGGEATHVWLAPDLSPLGMAGWEQHGTTRDQIIRLFYVGLTRARQTVTILAPAGPTRIPRQLMRPETIAA